MDHSARSTPRKSRAPPLRIKRRAHNTPDSPQLLLQDRLLLVFLISLRILNALTITTFFQPDEYYQSLEPAWHAVFGYGELTWEWREGIRGFLYHSVFTCLWWILKTAGVTNPYVLVSYRKRKVVDGRLPRRRVCRVLLRDSVIYGLINLPDGYLILMSLDGR